jgi:ACS family pantothenate transporter-like MFS transporter
MALQTRPRLYVTVPLQLVCRKERTDLRSAPYLLPTLEIVWAVLTFCQSRVTKLWQMYLLRALVGFFEAPSFGGTHLICTWASHFS